LRTLGSEDASVEATGEQRYESLLEQRLGGIAEDASLRTVARASRGLFPVDVRDWFLAHRAHRFVAPDEDGRKTVPDYRPELHLLDGEWYFAHETSERLARLLGAEPSLLLGVPTVAACLPGSGSVLVDRSPFIRDRFPKLATTWVRGDVAGARPPRKFRSVLLDPPWNMSDLFDWVRRASQALMDGGRIYLPLLGECTRPGADAQRAALLRYLALAGQVKVHRDAIEYDIPLFEYRTLGAAGAVVDGPWRRADLVEVTMERPLRATPPAGDPDPLAGDWETFLLGTQVVKLRRSVPVVPAAQPIAPVPMTSGYTLLHISRRLIDPSRIDIWTSRNKVASVQDYPEVRTVLTALQGDAAGLERRIEEVRVHRGHQAREIFRLLDF
jgi:hypothetical protein